MSTQRCTEITPQCPVEATTYGYYPEIGPNAFLCALFGGCLVASLVLGYRSRTWTYTGVLASSCFLEMIGYIGRLIMNSNPWDQTGFSLQIITLILGPSFSAAAISVTAKHIVIYCGSQYSKLKPDWYPWIYIGCDAGSIVLQAMGGGIAAGGSRSEDLDLLNVGNNLMIAGITFQVVTMAACGVLLLDFTYRYVKDAPQRRATNLKYAQHDKGKDPSKTRTLFQIFCAAISFAYICIMIRCIYRIPEMSGGWGNPLMRKEKEFLLLDGMMIGFAVVALTFIHPGIFFEPMQPEDRSHSLSNSPVPLNRLNSLPEQNDQSV